MKREKVISLTILAIAMLLLLNVNVKAEKIELSSSTTTSGLKKCIDKAYKPLVTDNETVWSVETSQFDELVCENFNFTAADTALISKFTAAKKLIFTENSFDGNLDLKHFVNNIQMRNNTFSSSVSIDNAGKIVISENNFNNDLIINECEEIHSSANGFNKGIIVNSFQNIEMNNNKNINYLLAKNGKNLILNSTASIEELNVENVGRTFIKNNTISTISLNSLEELVLYNNILKFKLLLTGQFPYFELNNNEVREVVFNRFVSGALSINEPSLENLQINDSNIKLYGVNLSNLNEAIIETSNITGNLNLNNSKVRELTISDSEIENLDVSNSLAHELIILNSKFSNLNLSNLENLDSLVINKSVIPTTLDFSKSINLSELAIINSNLKSINLEKNVNLNSLQLQQNGLTTLDLSNNKKLRYLDISNNNFDRIDLKNNMSLVSLNLEANKWNEKGFSKVEKEVKPKLTFKFIELIKFPENIAEGASFSILNKKYTSSDESIATVDEEGNIKTLKDGKVDIILEYTISQKSGFGNANDENVVKMYYETNRLIVSKDASKLTEGNYKFIKGANQKYIISETKELKFQIDAKFDLFDKVYIDGKEVSKSNYVVKSGSTIITFTDEYAKKLSTGKHTLKVTFTDGEFAQTEFTVAVKNPKTGYAVAYTLILVLIALGIVTYFIIKKQSKFPKHN